MLTDERGASRARLGAFALAASLSLVISPIAGGAPPANAPVRLADAPQLGAFNVGRAQATATKATDPAAGEVVKLDFTTPPGTSAGVWAKGFTAGLDPEAADVVRLGVRGELPEQAGAVTAAVEIKGTAGVQRVPLAVGPDWTSREVFVDWPAIGRVNEVVVSVSPGRDPAGGTVYFDVRFERLSSARKLSTSPVGRLGGVVAVAVLGGA
ncbi:MAG TPA: hypothetical protein VKD90_00545, partial [Gemmataceae bacterium]|nr:hypothetical protein [Gemmataceae bacterium]